MGISATSCLASGGPNEGVEVAEGALEDSNAMNLNAMNLNAMNLNAMNLNALHVGALSSSALASLRRPDSEGDLARQLLKYAASCALTAAQSIEIDWIDSLGVEHLETYWGLMGLAPSWASTGLSSAGERWVSACLASRVNWYGAPVLLSSRGSHPMLSAAGANEAAEFPMIEGAFWGNIFGSSPHVFACHDAANIEHSRQKLRDCAAGHVEAGDVAECGVIEIVGPCDAHCATSPANGPYFGSCAENLAAPGRAEVITVWLPL
jgi:hypothetical protein